ncbi:MAG: hypothetical protein WC633_11500, partial [Desulfurivibrionaceae bacterium]
MNVLPPSCDEHLSLESSGESVPGLDLLLHIPTPLEIYLPDGALLMANAAARRLPTFPAKASS